MSFALVPSQEDYFISTGKQNVPKPSVFKIEPIPSHEIPKDIEPPSPAGILADMSKFVRTNVDKGVKAIKNLVTPDDDTHHSYPKSYSLGKLFNDHKSIPCFFRKYFL